MNLQIFLLSMFLIFFKSSVPQQHTIAQIEFATSARGYHKSIIVTNHAITVVQQTLNDVSEHTTRKKITKNEWNHVLESIENVPVGEVSSLASPTTLRTSDAARASTLSITDVKGKTYSHTFDNENPNEKLQPLMKCIVMMEEHLKN